MIRIFKSLSNWILDIVFPPFCAGCEKFGWLLCPDCYKSIEYYTAPIKLNLGESYLDQVQAACIYSATIKKLIKAMKYQGVIEIGKICAELIYYSTWTPESIDCLTAVPIHQKRRKERGFNQAEVIAQSLALLLHKPYRQLLIRIKNTPQLAKLKHKQDRKLQLINHFAPSALLQQTQPNSVLLIDDVVTSGSTLNECAKLLKQNGTNRVYGLCVAHGI